MAGLTLLANVKNVTLQPEKQEIKKIGSSKVPFLISASLQYCFPITIKIMLMSELVILKETNFVVIHKT